MYNILTLFLKGKRKLHEEGFLALCRDALWSNARSYLWEHTLLDVPNIHPRLPSVMIEKIDSAKRLDDILAQGFDFSWYEMSLSKCKQRLKKGAMMFCAICGGNVIHVTWVGITPGNHGDFYGFAVDYGCEASIGGTMTAPRFEGKGVYTYVYTEIFRYLAETGKTKAIFQTAMDNRVVLNTQTKLGSRIRGIGHRLRVLLLLNFRWVKPYN